MRIFRRKEFAEEELAALADGSLPAARRAEVEAHVAASPELAALLAEQVAAVEAVRAVEVEAPARLRARVDAERAPRTRPPRPARLALAGGFAAAVAVAILALVTGLPEGAGGPSVAQAAVLAARPAAGPAPDRLADHPALLAADVEGVAFPSWDDEFAWRAGGRRDDRLKGRDTTTVFYVKDGKRIGYTIVGGDALPVPEGARPARRGDVRLHVFEQGERTIVTWQRRGRTCVLSAVGVPAETLLKLAAWNGKGSVGF
jgi:hypothetical protein